MPSIKCKRISLLRLSCYLLIFFFGLCPLVQAANPNLVLLPVQGEGLRESDKRIFQGAVQEGLSNRYEVFSGAKVQQKLKEISRDTICTAKACLENIAIAFNGELVARAFVERDADGYLLTLWVKNVFTDKVVDSISMGCPKCSKSDVIRKLKNMAKGRNGGLSGSVEYITPTVLKGPQKGGITPVIPKVSGDTTSDVAFLILDSDPTDAEVFLGDTYAGQTPFQNPSLKAGQKIQITLKKTNYHDKTIELTLSGGINELSTVKLKSTFGSLSVTSDPSGADVYLAGKKVGKTPYTSDKVKSRAYLLTIRKDLHLPIENQRVVIVDEKKTEKHFKLQPNFGVLAVDTDPQGADVSILKSNNEVAMSGTSPAELKIAPGKYRAVIKKKGYATRAFKVDIARNTKQRISKADCVLRKLEGNLIVSSDPYQKGASVYIDGALKGNVPLSVKILVGEYTVEIKAGEQYGVKKVVIADGKTATAQIKLSLHKTSVANPEDQVTNSIGMQFVYIKPGSFIMGSPSGKTKRRSADEKQHRVTLTKGFYMQTTEVTQGQWKAVMGNNPSSFKNCGDNCPVEQVSWNDTQNFIQKLNRKEGGNNYRLPTEAEWEYTCRAGSTTTYSFGNSDRRLGSYAWYGSNSGGKTHSVGQKKPNKWGIYDMYGNVDEWCQDWGDNYPPGSATDPVGPKTGSNRVLRGCPWFYSSYNNYGPTYYCRSASRGWTNPRQRDSTYGFRLVCLLRTQ